ncbi:MAG TPA: hypothetical protein VHO91_23785, partial [Rhodopila sp.]|nr:hypothetical protein [Rhodopila sp.]
SNDVINILTGGRSQTTVIFNNTTLAADSHFADLESSTTPTELALTGNDVNNGLISNDGGGYFYINVGSSSSPASFDNYGTITGGRGSMMGVSSGSTLTNHGLVEIPSRGTIAAGGLLIENSGTFDNQGTLLANAGTLNALADVVLINSGLVEAAAGATVEIGTTSATVTNPGTFTNSGTIEDKGAIVINDAVTQSGSGRTVIDGGNLKLNNAFEGGTIAIAGGNLELASARLPGFVGPVDPMTSVDFTGATGTVTIDGYDVTGLTQTKYGVAVSEVSLADGSTTATMLTNFQGLDHFQIYGSQVIYSQNAGAGAFQVTDTSNNQTWQSDGSAYSGPETGLDSQYTYTVADNINVLALKPNSFIRTGSGMDGINVSEAGGNNILDGSTGSNFLIGGTGHDTFFVDARGASSPVWSTAVNFHSGDDLTIWGVTQQDFSLLWLDNQGAAGATGLTGVLTESGHAPVGFTLAGLSSADLGNGKLSISYGKTADQPGIPGSSYMLIHAN